jgi:hypothetical protein
MMTMLVAVPILQASATEVINARVYSESGKTRIAIQLDGPVQYQTQLTSEPGISISLLKTGIGSVRKTIRGDGELVSGVTLKEIAGSIVDVNISLKENANFTVFPIESPDRIVVDITPAESPEIVQPLVGITSDPEVKDNVPVDPDASVKPVSDDASDDGEAWISSLLPIRNRDYIMAQLILNAVLVIALVVMGLKLWFIAKNLKKNHKILKKNQNFADMINGDNVTSRMQREAAGKSGTIGIPHATASQPKSVYSGRKETKKRRRGKQTASLQEQYREVYELAQLGMDRLAISQQSNIPIGEVNLILDLSKARSQAGQNS